jgi:hypothetical protein
VVVLDAGGYYDYFPPRCSTITKVDIVHTELTLQRTTLIDMMLYRKEIRLVESNPISQ